MTESRLVLPAAVGEGKGDHGGTLLGDLNLLFHDCVGSNMTAHILKEMYQIVCLKLTNFTVCKLFLRKSDFKNLVTQVAFFSFCANLFDVLLNRGHLESRMNFCI